MSTSNVDQAQADPNAVVETNSATNTAETPAVTINSITDYNNSINAFKDALAKAEKTKEAVVEEIEDDIEEPEVQVETEPKVEEVVEIEEEVTETEEEKEDREEREMRAKEITEARKPNQVRIKVKEASDVDRKALELFRENPKVGIDKCVKLAKDFYGVTDEQSETPKVVELTIADIEAKIAEVEALEVKAEEDFDVAALSKANREIRKLEKELAKAKKVEDDRIRLLEQEEELIGKESEKKAVAMYPDVLNTGSKLSQKIQSLHKQFEEDENPIVFDPKYRLKIAQMAANSLNIAPKSNSKTPVVSAVIPKTQPIVRPASGNARSTVPAPIDIKSVKMTKDEYRKFCGYS